MSVISGLLSSSGYFVRSTWRNPAFANIHDEVIPSHHGEVQETQCPHVAMYKSAQNQYGKGIYIILLPSQINRQSIVSPP